MFQLKLGVITLCLGEKSLEIIFHTRKVTKVGVLLVEFNLNTLSST